MSDQDPYQAGLEVVWRDPMGYDVREHGPPYMPVTAEQRGEGRKFAQRMAAFYDTGQQVAPKSPYAILAYLLAGLRILSMLHQTAHWQTRGGHFYGDHLLFQRLYDDTLPGIDSVAERLVGLTGEPEHVSLCDQMDVMHGFLKLVQGDDIPVSVDPEKMVRVALTAEVILLGGLTKAKEHVAAAGLMTDGLEDLLQGIASKHEEFVYLLKQRSASKRASKRATSYNYDRQG